VARQDTSRRFASRTGDSADGGAEGTGDIEGTEPDGAALIRLGLSVTQLLAVAQARFAAEFVSAGGVEVKVILQCLERDVAVYREVLEDTLKEWNERVAIHSIDGPAGTLSARQYRRICSGAWLSPEQAGQRNANGSARRTRARSGQKSRTGTMGDCGTFHRVKPAATSPPAPGMHKRQHTMDSTETDNTNPQPAPARRLLTPNEAADYLGVTEKFLENWRGAGEGPAFIKLSPRCVRYAPEDLDKHIEISRRRSTAQSV
jgi:Helix-turn-helix domain